MTYYVLSGPVKLYCHSPTNNSTMILWLYACQWLPSIDSFS